MCCCVFTCSSCSIFRASCGRLKRRIKRKRELNTILLLRCSTVHQTESCWKYKSYDSFFFAYTYRRYIVFSSTITYLVVHKYTYNALRPHKSTIPLRFTWHLPLDIDIWEELYITKYALMRLMIIFVVVWCFVIAISPYNIDLFILILDFAW